MLMPLREKQTAPQEDLQNAEAACAQAWTSNFTGNKEAKEVTKTPTDVISKPSLGNSTDNHLFSSLNKFATGIKKEMEGKSLD